jgi:hypothetical protein
MKQVEPLVPAAIGIRLGCGLKGRHGCILWFKCEPVPIIAAKPFPSG